MSINCKEAFTARILALAFILPTLLFLPVTQAGSDQNTMTDTTQTMITFDGISVGTLPDGWIVEGTNQNGPLANWEVITDRSAPSAPNVMALTDTKENSGGTFNLCWTKGVEFQNGVINVKVKAVAGREDQGGGLIWRVQDKDNYYIARWNPLEDNFRLYYVKDGRRKMLESAKIKSDPANWHAIQIEQNGDVIECYFDGEKLLTSQDTTFPNAGGIGLWTKADAMTNFDDFSVKKR